MKPLIHRLLAYFGGTKLPKDMSDSEFKESAKNGLLVMSFARLVDTVVEEYEPIVKSRKEEQELIITQQELDNIRRSVYQFADTQLVIRANVDGKNVSSLLLPPEEIEKFTDALLDILEHEPEILLAES